MELQRVRHERVRHDWVHTHTHSFDTNRDGYVNIHKAKCNKDILFFTISSVTETHLNYEHKIDDIMLDVERLAVSFKNTFFSQDKCPNRKM